MRRPIQDPARRPTAELITRSFKLLEKSEKGALVAIYATYPEAEAAVCALDESGIDTGTLSIVGPDDPSAIHFHDDVPGGRTDAWGHSGAFWGGLCGAGLGFALFLVSGVGPLLAAGPLVGWLVGGLEGRAVAGGMTSLGASLFSLGVPRPSISDYEAKVRAGKFVVVSRGSQEEVTRTWGVLKATPHQGVREHTCCV